MAFQVSPSVVVKETDLTSILPRVSVSNAGTVGQFAWGPINEIVGIDTEDELVNHFWKPTNTVYLDFMVSAAFLAYASNLKVVRVADEATALNATASASAGGAGLLVKNTVHYTSISFGSSTNLWLAKYAGTLGNNIGVAWADTDGYDVTDSAGDYTWPWRDLFTSAPTANEFHVVVYDATGEITGEENIVLETFPFVSTVSTDIYFDGTSAYFLNRINNGSEWLWVGKPSLLTGSSDGVTLSGGNNGTAITDGQREDGWELFLNVEEVDVSLLFAGGAGATTSQFVIQDVAEVRKDCIAFVSPLEADCVNLFDTDTIVSNVIDTRTGYGSSSYAVMDSTWKYTYDRYNDVRRWIPLNGDIAGLCARTDNTNDPWWSPAGFNRGNIKNVIKFSYSQPLSVRNTLYQAGINPCVIFPVDGAVLLGDKTLLSRPSAFSRINVRRLFIILEKAISTASKYFLFEFNDDFTRQRFVNQVQPYLDNVQGRRGLIKSKVICDTSNNTADVINSNEFVASIWVLPNQSINYITLDFVAVSQGVSFIEKVQSGPPS